MQIKLGTWEARASDERISFEGGAIESPTEARILADMLHRWADAFEASKASDPLDSMLEVLGPELGELLASWKRETEARADAYRGAKKRTDLN
jgi:hypothetical protein